jgi:hypothetical protein
MGRYDNANNIWRLLETFGHGTEPDCVDITMDAAGPAPTPRKLAPVTLAEGCIVGASSTALVVASTTAAENDSYFVDTFRHACELVVRSAWRASVTTSVPRVRVRLATLVRVHPATRSIRGCLLIRSLS